MITRTHLAIMLAIPVACAIFGAAIYSRLPNPCPTHWNINGEADKFGPPWQLAYGLPLVELGLAILLIALPWLGPFSANFERFRVIYGRIAVTVMTAIAAVNVVFALKAAGHPIHVGAAFSIIFGVLLVVLGNWMGKIRRNLYVGIRTPWTIANDLVWERTHPHRRQAHRRRRPAHGRRRTLRPVRQGLLHRYHVLDRRTGRLGHDLLVLALPPRRQR